MTRAPKQMALESLCSRVYFVEKQSLHSAARIPFILFAAMEIPIPVPQINRAQSAFFSVTAWQVVSAMSG